MTKQITVQYVNAPKTPKGPGSIKTNDGTYFKCWKSSKVPGTALLDDFEVGGEYEIEYTTEEYNGKPQYTVAKIVSGGGEVRSAHSNNSGSQPNGQNKAGATADRSAYPHENYNVSRWQTCLQVAGRAFAAHAKNGQDAKALIEFARELFAAGPDAPTTTVVSVSTDIEDVNKHLQVEASGW